ncbi:MAG: tetratricopeptide repeat protein, partial [Pseudomonadota bacterium]|nr:tetratricopeptide repeat protein [Pseudomonadota bacterium]
MDNTNNRFSKTSKTLIALAISGLVACGGSETALDHLENAKRNHTENDLQSAIVELKNSLKKDAASAEARALLGRIYSEKGLATDAEKELKRAIELGAPYNELALPLSSAMLMQGKADEVITEFAVTFSDREPTISIKSLALGESYFQKKDFPQAKKYLEAALENQKTRPRALLGQALISVVESKPDQAQLLVEKALKLDNSSLQAWMTQADIYRAKGDTEASERAYNEVAERSNGRSGYFYKLAMRHLIQLQLQRNDIEAADATLADLKKSFYKGQFPNDLGLTLLRSHLAYAKKDYESSSELANKALQGNKNLLGAKVVAGLSDARLDRLEQAETHLTSVLLQAPENEVARRALATIQLRLNNHDKTAETLEPFHQKLDELDSPTLALLAKAAYSSGETKRSSDYLRKALNLEPNNSELSLLLARSLSAENKYDQAIDVLKSIEKNASNSEQSLLSQAQVYIKAKDYDAALRTLDLLERENPSHLISSIKGTVYQLTG